LRPAEVQRAERAWFTRNRNGLDAAWVALVLLNVVAIAAWPSHAELLARDLDGRELRDIQTVLGEITRLRRLSERLR
jgi:hypothetical protein